MKKSIRIGSGSAWWGDRIEPAANNALYGDLDYLCFETMAEATVSAAQVRKRQTPDFPGYDTYLDDRMRAVLSSCIEKNIKIISNQGWINPNGAAQRTTEILREMGYKGIKVAAVNGSIITDRIIDLDGEIIENKKPISTISDSLISAEAYMGAEPIIEALKEGAQIVITGRVADPSLFLAPMVYEFNWKADDYDLLAAGSGIGHLMECGAQVTGGYFADPGFKDIQEPWNLAFPIVEVNPDGSAILSKLKKSGGEISLRTVKEQLLYEVHDPSNYITPDVIIDFTTVKLEQIEKDKVKVSMLTGKPKPTSLKVSIGCTEGFIGEDMFFYAGPGALQRAKLAKEILENRFQLVDLKADELRIEFLGVNAIHGEASTQNTSEPYEVAVRVAARTKTRNEANKVGREVDGMAVSGVSQTGKRVPHHERIREVIGIWSSLIPREAISAQISYYES